MRKADAIVKPCHIPAFRARKRVGFPDLFEFFQRLEADIGRDMEQPGAHEETVGDQGVRVGMEVEVLAEGVNRHDGTGQSLGQGKGGAPSFLPLYEQLEIIDKTRLPPSIKKVRANGTRLSRVVGIYAASGESALRRMIDRHAKLILPTSSFS